MTDEKVGPYSDVMRARTWASVNLVTQSARDGNRGGGTKGGELTAQTTRPRLTATGAATATVETMSSTRNLGDRATDTDGAAVAERPAARAYCVRTEGRPVADLQGAELSHNEMHRFSHRCNPQVQKACIVEMRTKTLFPFSIRNYIYIVDTPIVTSSPVSF